MQCSPLLQATLDRILKARVYDVAIETPLERAPRLCQRLNANVFLKREDTQPVFSFKIRGAYNRIRQLSAAERARGVICASAGNHAQGVAMSAGKLGIRSCIVMPSTTPQIKVDAVRNLGGEVVLFGDSYQEAQGEAERLRDEKGMVYIHPYDDPEVIAGQGTIALELLRQHDPEIDAVFIPVGGGGLLAGVGACLKALYPDIRIIGVEPVDAAGMTASLKAGAIVNLTEVGLFADGVAVKTVGKNTFEICKEVVDEMVTVDTDAICAAIKDVFEDTRTILEPAGALALAGCKAWRKRHPEGRPTLIALTGGANMNFNRLRHVAERAEFGEEREALLAVTIPEEPGSFKAFCETLGERGISEFNYRYSQSEVAHVFVGIQVNEKAEIASFIAELEAKGFKTLDFTGDEFAKLHLRHLVGGRAPLHQPERLFRFEFPERPGALHLFLKNLPSSCNITLFHYRNHGADIGRVLAGLQVPTAAEPDFNRFLENLGYGYVEESGHPAAKLFL
ncbi:threonine ammonia-lyase, biosynthetic [Kiritimatiellota bacterium B12222]|nr:threonine ammonia-lyase, biosynthetic [Kiritimatiellota bacterium B12222]